MALAEWQEAGTAGTREAGGCTSSGGDEGRRLDFAALGGGSPSGIAAGRRDFPAREEHGARALKTWPPAKNLRALKFCRLRARLRRLRAANSPRRRG